jgi:hypothetical protein
MMTWNEEQDSRLRELHASGIPLARIAEEMKLTRGQIHGRVWKLGLKRGKPKAKKAENDSI